jgi:hypothetical protein
MQAAVRWLCLREMSSWHHISVANINFTFPDIKPLHSVWVAAVIFRQFLPTQLLIFNDFYSKQLWARCQCPSACHVSSIPLRLHCLWFICERSCLVAVAASVVKRQSSHTAVCLSPSVDMDAYSTQQSYFIACIHCSTVMWRITTFRSTTDRTYDGGPIILQYCNITILTTVLQLPTVFSTVTCCTGL